MCTRCGRLRGVHDVMCKAAQKLLQQKLELELGLHAQREHELEFGLHGMCARDVPGCEVCTA